MSFNRSLMQPETGLSKAWLCILAIGLFVQVSGLLFNSDGSRYATQTYLLLFVPVLVLFLWQRLPLVTWHQVPGAVLLCLLTWVLVTGSVNAGSSHGPAYWFKIDVLILLYVFAVAFGGSISPDTSIGGQSTY